MINQNQLIEKLKVAFPDADINARDLTGGGDHWQVSIAASAFAGKSLVDQHKLVYAALGPWMHKEIHALSLSTREK